MRKNILISIVILLFNLHVNYAYQIKPNENKYIVGKGDILKIHFITPRYKDQIVTVSNDGFIHSRIIKRTGKSTLKQRR